MSIEDVFRRVVAALNEADIDYMVTGSFASSHFGAPRSTQDIDIVIAASPEQIRALAAQFPEDAYYLSLKAALDAQRHESLFNVVDLTTGWKVDFIIRKSRPFSCEEFERRKLVEFQGLRLFMATPEDVVIAKLEWAKLAESQRQIEDAARVLKARHNLDRSYMERWVNNLELTEQWSEALTFAGGSGLPGDNT